MNPDLEPTRQSQGNLDARKWVRVGKIVMLEELLRQVRDPEFRLELEEMRRKEVEHLVRKIGPKSEKVIEISKAV